MYKGESQVFACMQKLTRARHTQQVSVNTRTDGVTEETMTLQPCCAERNDLLQVAFDLGITEQTSESCRLQCWHNCNSSADDPRRGRPRASRTTALFTLNKECAKGVTFKSGLYNQLRKCHEDQLVPMCRSCYEICKPKIKLSVEQDPERRDYIVQHIRDSTLLDLSRLYKLHMEPVQWML